MYNTIDLFAGAGGLSQGFLQTGKFNIKVAFENNPIMQKTYKKNHPDTEVYGDVCEADYKKLQKEFGPIDVVIGGPPCQGFSNANRQKNHVISHNNALVKEYVRAIIELRPKAFVMENVSMLKSDVHRFYLSKADLPLMEKDRIKTKDTKLFLLDRKYMFDGIREIIQDKEQINEHLWKEEDFKELNVIFKALRNKNKRAQTLYRHKKYLYEAAKLYITNKPKDEIMLADSKAFLAIKKYYEGVFNIEDLQDAITPAIMYQKMLNTMSEVYDNNLIIERYSQEGDLYVFIKSYAVFDYFNEVLGEGDKGYVINSDVLSAADFGAPQKRFRFIAIGIRKDIANKVQMPVAKFNVNQYRRVSDAIEDLEEIPPVYNAKDDTGIPLERRTSLSDLASELRDSEILYNHIITKTTDIALQRFHEIKQGQNFHSLPDEMKTNTYTDISRTQNTVYLRLKYNEPCGTVVNVRKSMWIHPTQDRAISVREAARLQTFRDSYIFTGTKDKQYQQVGNAVPPILAEAIAQTLADQLDRANIKDEIEDV